MKESRYKRFTKVECKVIKAERTVICMCHLNTDLAGARNIESRLASRPRNISCFAGRSALSATISGRVSPYSNYQIKPLFTYTYTSSGAINFLRAGISGWKRPLGTPGKKRSEQRGEKLYLKNLSSPSAGPDVFPSRVEISTSPSQ